MAGSGHASFLDLGFLPLADESRAAGGMTAVNVDPLRAWRFTCDFLSAFFGRHLLGDDALLLDDKVAAFPEVRVGAPRDLLAY
jgi:hypothetical protein